jgi:serine acetyltransferase
MARQQWARPGIGTAAFPLVTENPVSAGARNTVLGGFQLGQKHAFGIGRVVNLHIPTALLALGASGHIMHS